MSFELFRGTATAVSDRLNGAVSIGPYPVRGLGLGGLTLIFSNPAGTVTFPGSPGQLLTPAQIIDAILGVIPDMYVSMRSEVTNTREQPVAHRVVRLILWRTGGFTITATGTANPVMGITTVTSAGSVNQTKVIGFAQSSGQDSYVLVLSDTGLTFGAGLIQTLTGLSLELDLTADAQGVGVDGGSSGLEFDIGGDEGKLRVRVDPFGGIVRSPNGLSVLSSPQTADIFVSGEALTAGDAVSMSAVANEVVQATAAVVNEPEATNTIGVTLDSAGAQGVGVRIVQAGVAVGVLSGAVAGSRYYVQAAGGIGTTVPTGANRAIEVGVAKNATDLIVRIIDRGIKAA